MPIFTSDSQRATFSAILRELRAIGYADELLQEDYRFGDWFDPSIPERKAAAAAFGQTPVSYDSALFGVVLPNGISGTPLIAQYRALGAPIVFEVSDASVRQWVIGPNEQSIRRIAEFPGSEIGNRFAAQAGEWTPAYFLRAKSIGDFRWNRQLELFAGVLPELENQIQAKLSPMLRAAMSAVSKEYMETNGHEPDPHKLFMLVFWLLTGKVFRDREIRGFRSLEATDAADDVLLAVARHYRQEPPRLLNRQTRDVAFSHIWSSVNFRNLSVDVLAQLWSTALVTDEARRRLGIHKTPRFVAKYLVDQIEFDHIDDERKTVVEPCCGSAVFLIAAMNRLRSLQWGLSPRDRHVYFRRHLIGYEVDPFGVEISRLALALADFPNANGWQIHCENVFNARSSFAYSLQTAGIVLCNPPFEPFDDAERSEYGTSHAGKPVELLHLVLDHLHPRGVVGFVLPKNIVDGREYKAIRRKLSSRFASIEITSLPDRAFEADHEVALLVAQRPIPHVTVALRHAKVADSTDEWHKFEARYEVTSSEEASKTADECEESLGVPELSDVWRSIARFDKLGDIAELHRGIEWNLPLTSNGVETGNRSRLIRDDSALGFELGVPPEADISCFVVPRLKYLDMRPEHQRGNSYKNNWRSPKVMLNAATKSRRGWRMAAFADEKGLVAYQNVTAVWTTKRDLAVLTAVLNGPIANAFVATIEGKRHVTIETLRGIPIPKFTEEQVKEIRALVQTYLAQAESFADLWANAPESSLEATIKTLDAVVLEAYDLPPRLERKVLDFFKGQSRAVPFTFNDYFPPDFVPCFSLREFLSDEFQKSTAEHFRGSERPPDHILKALSLAAGEDDM